MTTTIIKRAIEKYYTTDISNILYKNIYEIDFNVKYKKLINQFYKHGSKYEVKALQLRRDQENCAIETMEIGYITEAEYNHIMIDISNIPYSRVFFKA